MKHTVKWIVLALLLVGVLVLAGSLYSRLSREYAGNPLMPPVNPGGDATDPAPGDAQADPTDSTPAESDTAPEETVDKSAFAAPDFTVYDWDGNPVSLSDYRGKPVVLNFWATWCYYCKVEMPDFDAAREKYPDVQFLMVNATDGVRETVEKAKAYVEEAEYGFDVLFDTDLDAVYTYGITGFPTTFFIDADGTLITYANGMLNLPSLEKAIGMIVE
jgi:thiol-disulfide isomerase/thioredoxin